MNWRYKSKIQNLISLFPFSIGNLIYYYLQNFSGSFKNANPIPNFNVGIAIAKEIFAQGKPIQDKTIFEIGTGRRVNVPLVFWLLGAKEIITVDLHTYLRKELILKDLAYIKENSGKILELFAGLELDKNRFQFLVNFLFMKGSLQELLSEFNIRYISPCDAGNLKLSNNSVDYHISTSVLEHIPQEGILSILKEGNRIVAKEGLFLHRIDLSDHFSHDDNSISPINFLQFNEIQWEKIVSNRFMYANRLRFDDYQEIYKELKHHILAVEPNIDMTIQHALDDENFILDNKFKKKSNDILVIRNALFVSQFK